MEKSIKRFVSFFSLASVLIGGKLVLQIQNAGNKWYEVFAKYCSIVVLALLVVSAVRIAVFYYRYDGSRRFHELITGWAGYYPDCSYRAEHVFPIWTVCWCVAVIYAYNVWSLVILCFLGKIYVDMWTEIRRELDKWMKQRTDFLRERAERMLTAK